MKLLPYITSFQTNLAMLATAARNVAKEFVNDAAAHEQWTAFSRELMRFANDPDYDVSIPKHWLEEE